MWKAAALVAVAALVAGAWRRVQRGLGAPSWPRTSRCRCTAGREHFDGAQEISLSDLEGRPVIINFWAPLCPPCRAEMPHFQEVWDDLQAEGSDAVVLGIDVGSFTLLGDRPQSIEFLETIDLTYPVGEALDRSIIVDYGVQGMPTTVFVNADGTIHRTWVGAISKDQLQEVTDAILQ